MKCTIKEQENCQVEKMGCKGCYYNIDKEIEDLNDFADLLRSEQRYYTNIIKKVIEDRLKDREKIKVLEEQIEYDKTHIFTPATIKLNYISKQTVKDKIEKIFDVKIHNYNYLANTDWNYGQEQVDRQIASILKRILDEVLDELLKEREK